MSRSTPLLAVVCTVASLLSTGPTASATADCGPTPAEALSSALAQLPPDPMFGLPWSHDLEDSNYDPCADLSAMVVTIERGTGSSPDQALMFHRGEFLGTGTWKPYPFTQIEHASSTTDSVLLSYKDPRYVCSACDGAQIAVRYQWQGDHVEMFDPPPPW